MKKFASFSLLTCVAVMAFAQDLPYTVSNPPPPTACGEGGIGLNGKTKLPEARDATPGKRVGDDGFWATCKMPPDCQPMPAPQWLGKCSSENPLPSGYFGKTYQRHDKDFQGLAYYRCTGLGNGRNVWLLTSSAGKTSYCSKK